RSNIFYLGEIHSYLGHVYDIHIIRHPHQDPYTQTATDQSIATNLRPNFAAGRFSAFNVPSGQTRKLARVFSTRPAFSRSVRARHVGSSLLSDVPRASSTTNRGLTIK